MNNVVCHRSCVCTWTRRDRGHVERAELDCAEMTVMAAVAAPTRTSPTTLHLPPLMPFTDPPNPTVSSLLLSFLYQPRTL